MDILAQRPNVLFLITVRSLVLYKKLLFTRLKEDLYILKTKRAHTFTYVKLLIPRHIYFDRAACESIHNDFPKISNHIIHHQSF
jgi:hypothetical protein